MLVMRYYQVAILVVLTLNVALAIAVGNLSLICVSLALLIYMTYRFLRLAASTGKR
jgi:hypothetical protein